MRKTHRPSLRVEQLDNRIVPAIDRTLSFFEISDTNVGNPATTYSDDSDWDTGQGQRTRNRPNWQDG